MKIMSKELLALVFLTVSPIAVEALSIDLDAERLERLDTVFRENLERYDIPGGVITVVKDGELVHARAFGVEDLATGRAVDPDRTLFYLSSVTKSFTATAVLQLVAEGRLELDRNVNEYLVDFQVDETFDEPITLHHLLTHTAGFDARIIGYVARSVKEAEPMGEYLAVNLPPRVRPPGEVISYSNHGYGLAGHLVELASGESFEEYLENRILRPLGMSRSTAYTSPPPELAKDLATGHFYNAETDQMEPHPLGGRNIPPAGTVIATGTDVARFMIAHLENGLYGSTRILDAEMSRRQQRRQFSHHPELPGIAYGFWETNRRGRRSLEHQGGYPGWASLMALIPEEGLGIFMATNQSTSFPHYAALDALLDGEPGDFEEVEPLVASGDRPSLERFRGTYQATRYSRSTIEKLAILDTQIYVEPDEEGFLTTFEGTGDPRRWVEVEPLLFRRFEANEYLAFRGDGEGKITHLFDSSNQLAFPNSFERLGWKDNSRVQLPYILVAMIVFLASVSLWPLSIAGGWLVCRIRSRPRRAPGRQRIAVTLAILISVLSIGFIVGLVKLLGNGLYQVQLAYGMTSAMIGLLWVPVVITALTPLLVWFSVESWRRRWWTVFGRAWYACVALTAVTFIVFLLNWRLLGFWY